MAILGFGGDREAGGGRRRDRSIRWTHAFGFPFYLLFVSLSLALRVLWPEAMALKRGVVRWEQISNKLDGGRSDAHVYIRRTQTHIHT